MLQTLAITGPIYLVIALGFGAVRFNVFGKADMRVLGTYVVRFALPALVFTALSQRPMSEIMNGRYLLGYAVGSLVVMMGALTVAWRWQRKSFTLSALIGLGTSSSNSRFIGYPIAIAVGGPSSEPTLRATAVIFAATPMLSIYPILAQRYGYEDICAAAQLLATVLSFVTISLVLWFLGSAVGWV